MKILSRNMRSEELKKAMNGQFGRTIVKDLRFRDR